MLKKIKAKFNRLYFFNKYPHLKFNNLELHPKGEFISDSIRSQNTYYELDMLIYIFNNFNCERFCDIGANIGNHSNFFSNLGSKGWAFEPSKRNFELLKKNVPNFNLYNLALSDIIGTERFVSYEDSCGNSNLVSNFDNKTQSWGKKETYEEVKVDLLDSFNIDSPTFIKIDVEGAELKVLYGAIETIKKFRPVICIELHTDENLKNAGFPYSRKDINNFFDLVGYKLLHSFDETNHFYTPK